MKCLSILCKNKIHLLCPDVDIDALVGQCKLSQPSENLSTPSNPAVNFDDFLKTLAFKWVTVTVSRFSTEMVQLWTKTHWTNHDPYSDLEEEPPTPSKDNTENIEPKNYSGVNFDYIGGHVLRCQKRPYHTVCSRCANTCYSFYRDMCAESAVLVCKPKLVWCDGLKTPSKTRLSLQAKIRESNR